MAAYRQCWKITVAASVLLSVVACSRSSSGDSAATMPSSGEKALTESEIYKMYDPSSLVEVKTLHGLPEGVQTLLGVHATGYARIADVGEECNPTDVVGPGPGRCFFVGGASDSGALVAFKVGGFAGQSGVAEGYVHVKSGWIKVRAWAIGYPSNLRELREMTSVPPDDRPPQPFNDCFREINGRCSY
jgi:hypothetical protein